MTTTFFNPPADADNFNKSAARYLKSVAADLKVFMEDTEGNEDIGNFYDYGLCFDLVEIGTFEDQSAPYYCYQISYGGPSFEIRIYSKHFIEAVYLDWFSGKGFDVTNEDWAQWLYEWFVGCGMIDLCELY